LRDKTDLEKRYLAVVHGRWPRRQTRVDLPLAKGEERGGERYSRVDPAGKPCLTRIRVIAATEEMSLIEAMPVTGRMHQIRVHCAARGHPVVGDEKYGNRELDERVGTRRMMLHAVSLHIPALSGQREPIDVEAEPDAAFERLASQLKQKVIASS
ncbi:MAG: RNA pseudouridine synthase, partial [Pseudomonadales bacterium]|nr:RNA pseudouridine synthase [Pseudomonadales bacterium]